MVVLQLGDDTGSESPHGTPECWENALGEGKWGRTKYRRIPESEGDWKGQVPKCSLPRKLFKNKGFGAPIF